MQVPVSSMKDLLDKIEEVAEVEGAKRVKRIAVRFGANSFIDPEKFRTHFGEVSTGSVAEGCRLSLQFVETEDDPFENNILLVGVDCD